MKINFSYNRTKIECSEGYIFKGKFYRCNYCRFKTLYRNPAKGTETVQLYNFEPKSDIRASVVILPGLGSSNIKFFLWMGTHLASVGVHSTVVILPGNYTRVEDKSTSGKSYLYPDMKRMFQFWEHAVVDVLSTIDILEQKKVWSENNCILGYCLGGMINTIVSALDQRAKEKIFMTTGGYLPKIIHQSIVTGFVRKKFKDGYKSEYFLHDKKKIYEIYKKQFPLVREMSLLEIMKTSEIHPLFKIDPISYAHLIDKKDVTFIDAFFDTTLPVQSRISLYKEMKDAVRYVVPITHVGWLPFERFLAQYILLKLNINDNKSMKMVTKKLGIRI
ncbi:alpha/beta fold hydrolase [Clostridium sp. DL1XJH146]